MDFEDAGKVEVTDVYKRQALVDGRVKYERKGRDKKQVSVYPVETVEIAE